MRTYRLLLAVAVLTATLCVVGAGRSEGQPCIAPDNGTGTVTLPAMGCSYTAPEDVMELIDGLPPGTTIQLDPEFDDFVCGCAICSLGLPGGVCEGPGGSLGGDGHCFESTLYLSVTGTGDLTGFTRSLAVPIQCEVHTAPRTPGEPVQTFEAGFYRLQGGLFGDPDFDTLQITGGTDYGLPSPGETTLTDLGDGTFNVDSFFDITYQIDFEGAPGSALDGFVGTTLGTVRIQQGAHAPGESDVLPGCDLYRTVENVEMGFGGGEGTFPPLPADFFGPGSDPFDGIIALRGSPLGGDYDGADTVVQRTEAAELPESDTVEIEIIELSLVSVEPITVTFDGGMTESFFDVYVTLDLGTPSLGDMVITKTHENGGVFSAEIDVWLALMFAEVEGPGETALDVGPLGLTAEDVPWEYDIPLWFDCPECASNFAPGSDDGEILPFTWDGDYYDQTVEFGCARETGIKFSVHDEPLGTLATIGMPATDVNMNATTRLPSLEADIYEGAYGGNWIVILKERLGLQDNDDIDALAIWDDSAPTEDHILFDAELLTWHFSVDPASTGVQGVPPDVFSQQSRNEAAGDVFVTLPPVLGANMLAIDDWWIGLDDTTAPLPEDDQDALDLVEPEGWAQEDPLPAWTIVFSLTPDSPSLANPPGYTPGDILFNDGAGGFTLFEDDVTLGIPNEDLDALAMSIEGLPVFSVAPGGPNGLDPADLLVRDNTVAPDPDSLADTLIPAAGLGLVPDHDNVNSLDVRHEPFIVEHDSDGDGMPDDWEYENDFDPNDPDEMGDDGEEGSDGTPDGDNDWDGDGFTNQEEYDAGSDPRDPRWTPEIHYTPLTGAFTAAILALAIGVLGYRKRRA